MNVMSINVCCWGDGKNTVPRRAPHIVDLIRRYEPDIIGLQEVTEWWMTYLKECLPQYSLVGIGRERKGKGEASPILFRRSRFELKNGETFWLSETPDKVSKGWDGAYNRVCTVVVLQDMHMGRELTCFNTHLDHMGPIAQRNGARLINERIQEIQSPVILTGDFNVEPDSDAYREISLRDTRISVKSDDSKGTYHDYGRIPDEEAPIIDYCFHSEGMCAKRYTVLRDVENSHYLTDHYAVLAEFAD